MEELKKQLAEFRAAGTSVVKDPENEIDGKSLCLSTEFLVSKSFTYHIVF